MSNTFFLRWRVCFFPPDCPTPLTLPPTSTRSPMTTIVDMETLPLPWRLNVDSIYSQGNQVDKIDISRGTTNSCH